MPVRVHYLVGAVLVEEVAEIQAVMVVQAQLPVVNNTQPGGRHRPQVVVVVDGVEAAARFEALA